MHVVQFYCPQLIYNNKHLMNLIYSIQSRYLLSMWKKYKYYFENHLLLGALLCIMFYIRSGEIVNRRMLESYISELGSFCKSKETFVHVHNL